MRSPLQNRVDPFGEIHAVPTRGTLMGNRGGCLHDPRRQLGRHRWVSRHWIACELAFNGRHRTVMTPGRYTELFFPHSPGLCGEVCHRSAKASRSENLQIEEPVCCG
jgi:hypothetical protein